MKNTSLGGRRCCKFLLFYFTCQSQQNPTMDDPGQPHQSPALRDHTQKYGVAGQTMPSPHPPESWRVPPKLVWKLRIGGEALPRNAHSRGLPQHCRVFVRKGIHGWQVVFCGLSILFKPCIAFEEEIISRESTKNHATKGPEVASGMYLMSNGDFRREIHRWCFQLSWRRCCGD